jgi:hypothetical protein
MEKSRHRGISNLFQTSSMINGRRFIPTIESYVCVSALILG